MRIFAQGDAALSSEMKELKRKELAHIFPKRWRRLVMAASVLLFSVVMLLLFPRQEHTVLSTLFAVLFWLSLAAVVIFGAVAIRNRSKSGEKWAG